MINLKVEVRGDRAIVNALQQVHGKVRRDGLKEVAEAALASISRRVVAGRDENDRPLKPIKRQGSTILNDTGKMLASMRILDSSPARATIGFSGAFEGKKAWWQHHGTDGPYPIRPKNGKALAFKTSMSFATAMAGSKRGRSTRLTMENARAGAQGMAIVRGVMHPGLPPRPFFGISPNDERNIQTAADAFLRRVVPELWR